MAPTPSITASTAATGPLASDLRLHDEIGADEGEKGIVEKPAQHGGCQPEWHTADDAERCRRHRHAQEVCSDHACATEILAVYARAESLGPQRVDLDGEHLSPTPRAGQSERTEAGSEIEDQFAGLDLSLGDHTISEVGS